MTFPSDRKIFAFGLIIIALAALFVGEKEVVLIAVGAIAGVFVPQKEK